MWSKKGAQSAVFTFFYDGKEFQLQEEFEKLILFGLLLHLFEDRNEAEFLKKLNNQKGLTSVEKVKNGKKSIDR